MKAVPIMWSRPASGSPQSSRLAEANEPLSSKLQTKRSTGPRPQAETAFAISRMASNRVNSGTRMPQPERYLKKIWLHGLAWIRRSPSSAVGCSRRARSCKALQARRSASSRFDSLAWIKRPSAASMWKMGAEDAIAHGVDRGRSPRQFLEAWEHVAGDFRPHVIGGLPAATRAVPLLYGARPARTHRDSALLSLKRI